MSLIPGRVRASSRGELLLGGSICLVVLGLALAAPADVGMLLAALAIGVTVALVVLNDPLLALLLVVAASFFRLAQKQVVPTEVLTPAFVLLVAAVAYAVSRGTRPAPAVGTVEWLMAVYLAWNILSWLLPHRYDAIDPLTGESQDVFRWILTGAILPFGVYLAAKSVLHDERSVRWMLWTTVGMTAYSSWVSIMQFHGPRALVWPRYIVDSPNWVGRANGVFNQPVVNGIILDIGFVACLFLASRAGTSRNVRILLYVLAAATAYSVYLTHTRAALLGLVIAVGMGVVFAAGWRRAFVVSAVLGLAVVAVNASTVFSSDRSSGGVGSSDEIYDRLNIIATAWQAISEHPFVGIGLNRFLVYNTWNHQVWPGLPWIRGYGIISHENEIGIAAEIGVPGALAWVAVIVGILYLLWRAMRELPRDGVLGAPLALVGAIAMLIMVMNGVFVDMRILDFATILPFVYAGMVVGQLERHRKSHGGPRPGVVGAGLPGAASQEHQRERHDRDLQDRERLDRGAARPAGDPRLEPAR